MSRTAEGSADVWTAAGRARRRARRRSALTASVAVGIGVAALLASTSTASARPGIAPLREFIPVWEGAGEGSTPRPVGSQFHGLWALYTHAERVSVLDRLQAAGVRSVRIDLSWLMLQPDGPGRFDRWGVALVDQVVGMANDRGIRPLMTLWLSPAWANGHRGERALPSDPAHYARVAGWAAERWRGRVVGWEVWNEPNDPVFMPGSDPAAYARLLRAAYPAIKQADPGAAVVFGGVQYNDTEWIERAYAAGAGGAFDVMATHPYQGIADLDPRAQDGTKWTLTHAAAVHRLMRRHGDGGKPIWFTEFGWSTHDLTNPANWLRGVTEAEQARFLVEAAALVGRTMPYVTRMYWYNDRDMASGGHIQYRNYGLFRQDLSAKPALGALAAVNRRAAAG